MSLFERLKNKTLSLQEKKEDKTDKGVKQSEVSKQAKKFTKKINQKNINRPEGVIGDTYVSTDKKGNIRSAKKVNPTLKKSVSQVKADIEFQKGIQQSRKLSGSKGTGELSDKAPQNVRSYVKKVRDKRIKDLKLPDTSFNAKTKFSQKAFEKSLKTSTKGQKTGIVDPFKGSAITKGQANVKGLASKAFKKTKPSDIKLPKSFTDFSSKLQDFKDKDKATMRTGKSSSKVKVSGANNLSRQDVGMAPPDDTPKKTKPQKGVSATEITKKYNQKRAAKASKNTMPSGKDFINKYKKQAETATTNLRKKVDTIAKNPKLTGSEKALKSRSVMKDVKTAQNFARGYANPKTVQTAITVPKDIKTVQSAVKGAITKKGRTITKKFGVGATKYATKSGANIAFGKSPAGKIVKKIGLKPTYGTRKIATTLVKKGGLPAVVGLGLLSSPYARTAIKGALLGGGLSAFKNPKPKLAKLSSKKIVGSSVKLGQKIPTTLPKPK